MLSPEIRLALAITLAGAPLTFLAVTLNAAKTRETVLAAPPPLKAKILRRKDKLNDKLDAQELNELRRQIGQEPAVEERQLEDTTPKHVPIKLKIKAEKEKSFKDLKNDKWLRELEIEVKNTGTKPIYFLSIGLDLPDTLGPNGNPIGWGLDYGRSDLISITEPLKSEDIPIQPGQTHIFRIAERFVAAWEKRVKEGRRQPKKLRVIFQFINFGDGTGYWGGTAAPLPPPKRASTEPCKQKGGETQKANTSLPLIAFNATGKSRWFEQLPAILPANFLGQENLFSLNINAEAEPDVCCPGSSCTWAKQTRGRCQCSDINRPEVNDMFDVQFPACSDSSGACSTVTLTDLECQFPNVDGTTFELHCTIPFVFPCLDYAPTPPPGPSPSPTASPTGSPTPTPAPTCDPATKPNDRNCFCAVPPAPAGQATAQWSCSCNVDYFGFVCPVALQTFPHSEVFLVTAAVHLTWRTTALIAAFAACHLPGWQPSKQRHVSVSDA